MISGYTKLRPLGLAVGFAVAAVVEIILIYLPMAAIHHGMMRSGAGMMGPGNGMIGAGQGIGVGMGILIAIWLIIVSAIVGALVAVVYNAFVSPKT
jgi:hypothetical protein